MADISLPSVYTSNSTTSAFTFVFSANGTTLPEKRTNSLAFSASDCHTCKSMRRLCDRRRPRCSGCTNSGVTCSGYVQKLDWQVGVASRGKMARKTFDAPAVQGASSPKDPAEVSRPKNFAFVLQKNGRRRKRARPARRDALKPATDLDRRQPDPRKKPRSKTTPGAPEQEVKQESSPRRTLGVVEELSLVPCPSLGNFYSLPPEVAQVLDFYQWRYSFIPLTFQVQVNPWHMCLSMAYEDPCLMHAILALGKRYSAQLFTVAEDVKVLELKGKALTAFGTALQDEGRNPRILIGTILALVALDYAESGFSNWSVHFHGAYRVIQAAGGIEIAEQDSALQSQIAMLLWYDVTSALISRRAPVFPRSVLEALMEWQSQAQWTMLALNGFPDDLLLDIYDVTWAASHPIDVDVDDPDGEASKLYRRLWSAQLDAPDANIARLMDCWRLSLLLYCTRLFEPRELTVQRKSTPSVVMADHDDFNLPSLSMATPISDPDYERRLFSPLQPNLAVDERCQALAEEIFWLVRELPPTSDIQKQCLIPIALAACEMDSDEENFPFRIMAEQYCRRWSRQSGLRTFDTALGLMQTVWKVKDGHAGYVWWADLVGSSIKSQFTSSNSCESTGESLEGDLMLTKEFLLG